MKPSKINIDLNDDDIYDYVLEKKTSKHMTNTCGIARYFSTTNILIFIIIIALIIFAVCNKKWLLS